MKKLLLSIFLCFLVANIGAEKDADKVFICTGAYSKVYHSTPQCKGLGRCSGDVKAVPLESVRGDRRACKICY